MNTKTFAKTSKWATYQAYKDSGIEWLGEIPKGWNTLRMKYVSSINDASIPETTSADYGLLYVDISNVDEINGIQKKEKIRFGSAPSRARRKVKDGDVIISTVRTYLRAIAPIVQPESNLVVSTGFAVIRPRHNLKSAFAAYALCSPYFIDTVVSLSVGVSYPAINASDIATIGLAIPPLIEQTTIAAFLDRETSQIDTLIEKKQRQIELLKEKRTALISHTVTKGLDPKANMKDSGIEWLGEIPGEWDILPIKRITSTRVTDGPHETPDFLNEGVPFISAEAIKNDKIVFSKIRGFISQDDHARFSRKYKPQKGDIFLIKSGATTGNVACVETDKEFNIWSPLAAIRPHAKKAASSFVFFFMKSRNFFQSIEIGWNYGTQQNIGMNVIENIMVALPPLKEQTVIANYLEHKTAKIDTLIEKVQNSIELLREKRAALITAAVTGKIDVREEAA